MVYSFSADREVFIGAELECILWDCEEHELLSDERLLSSVLRELPSYIHRDYYSWQLEIKTHPHQSPDDLLREVDELYKTACDEFEREHVLVYPVSAAPFMLRQMPDEVFCGLHFHISISNADVRQLARLATALYPVVLPLAAIAVSSPNENDYHSLRLLRSRHISFPPLEPDTLLRAGLSSRYYDIIINSRATAWKSVPTIEVRFFDSCEGEWLSYVTKCLFFIVQHLDTRGVRRRMKMFQHPENAIGYTRYAIAKEGIYAFDGFYGDYIKMELAELYKHIGNIPYPASPAIFMQSYCPNGDYLFQQRERLECE